MNLSKDEIKLTQELESSLNEVLNIAFINFNKGNIDDAKKLYLGIIDILPLHAEANHNLGVIEAKIGLATDALPRLEIAIKAKPENEQYWVSYIEALIIFEDYSNAETAISHGLDFGLSGALAAILKEKIYQRHIEKQQLASTFNADNLPRITTLIPAYKPSFIIETLLALTAQTYTFFEVIVSDDSTDQIITQLLASPECAQIRQKLNFKVVQGPRKGGMSNILHLLSQCDNKGLIHVLMDDDLIYPKFYEKHVMAHLQKNISVSVSYRWFCNQYGQPLGVSAVPEWINNAQQNFMVLNAAQLFGSVIPKCDNWLGEFSNSVFKPAAIHLYTRSRLENIAYYGLGDIGTILEASLHGELVLIKEYLGAFRQHETQFSSQQHSKVFQCGVIAWVALALGAYRAQQINANTLQLVVHSVCKGLIQRYSNDPQIYKIIQCLSTNEASGDQFSNEFNQHWENFIVCQDWLAAHSLPKVATK